MVVWDFLLEFKLLEFLTDAFPNQGETTTADPLYKAYHDDLPENIRIILPEPDSATG